jgi:hypothetical protein
LFSSFPALLLFFVTNYSFYFQDFLLVPVDRFDSQNFPKFPRMSNTLWQVPSSKEGKLCMPRCP